MSSTYCPLPFTFIYSDSADAYRPCCYGSKLNQKPSEVVPFDFFLSDEMQEVRRQLLNDEKPDACMRCFDKEKGMGVSPRVGAIQRYGYISNDNLRPLTIQMKLFGSSCNLSCYMCNPYNSSERRKEIKKLSDDSIFFTDSALHNESIARKDYDRIINNLLENIEKVGIIIIMGGEPVMMQRHWEFLDMIPDDVAKNIAVRYQTNLTQTHFKKWSLYDTIDKFGNVAINVSCDHYGDKLKWIRYPIDVDQFENNLKEFREHIDLISGTVSLLNIDELDEIKEYYESNFEIEFEWANLVYDPEALSIRQLQDDQKLFYLSKYANNPLVVDELLTPRLSELDQVTQNYFKELDKIRSTDVNRIFAVNLYE